MARAGLLANATYTYDTYNIMDVALAHAYARCTINIWTDFISLYRSD